MLKVCSVILLSLLSLVSVAQGLRDPTSMLSPNAASLGTYGDISVSLFSGQQSVSIPVYEIKVGPHSVPLTLNYRAGGVRVEERPGWVGTDWSLSCGGAITRKIKGWPDEKMIVEGDDYVAIGFYHCASHFKESTAGMTVEQKTEYCAQQAINGYDTQPDEFSFSYPGGNGNFWYSEDGKWLVRCDKPVKVIFEGNDDDYTDWGCFSNPTKFILNDSRVPFSIHQFKRFFIIDEAGTKYTFGGEDAAIEYSLDMFNQYGSLPEATTWHLTKIEYIDGHEVNLSYHRGNFIAQTYLSDSYVEVNGHGQMLSSTISSNIWGAKLIYPSYLQTINTSEDNVYLASENVSEKDTQLETVADGYSENFRNNPINNGALPAEFMPFLSNNTGGKSIKSNPFPACLKYVKPHKLTKIMGKRYDVSFYYTDLASRRLMLDSVVTRSKNNKKIFGYTFEYDRPENIPPYMSRQNDHWGYINGVTSPRVHEPGFVASLEPDPDKGRIGSLKKITYPTGGASFFEYEPHTYGARATSDGTSFTSMDHDTIAGGLRISKILNSPTGKIEDATVFKEIFYTKKYVSNGDNGRSSGVLTQPYQYSYPNRNHKTTKGTVITTSTLSAQSLLPSINPAFDHHVEYGEVTEKYADGSFRVYNFTTFSNGHPDSPVLHTLNANPEIYEPKSSRAMERGLVTSINEYDSDKKRINGVFYHYRASSDEKFVEYSTTGRLWDYAYAYYEGSAHEVYLHNMLVKKIIDGEINGTKNLFKTTDFTYDSHKQLSKSIVSSPDGVKTTTTLTYPYDHISERSWDFAAMTSANRINLPVCVTVERSDKHGNSKKITTRDNYKSSKTGPTQITRKEDDGRELTVDSYLYDCYGNVINHYSPTLGTASYIWSALGTRLVAKINGGDQTKIEKIIGDIDTFSKSTNIDYSKLSLLNDIPNSQVTIFHYNNAKDINPSKITLPDGSIRYFGYDYFNRLYEVRNSSGELIERYQYNYAN